MSSKSQRRISYILCTRNKLAQLRCTVPDLLAGYTPEDEIIVFDGNSTDGSREFLQGLFDEGRFSVYRSERDWNQAHALNKAMFLARGEIIKVVLDDDVLDYGFMQKCAEFFLAHPEIDALGANIGLAGEREKPMVLDLTRQAAFEQWAEGGPPFWFQDQSFTYRRSSLPVVGLWHTGVNCIDVEMTMRLTSLRQARLAWYTGNAAVRVMNADSLSQHSSYLSQVPVDFRRIHAFYGVECPPDWRLPRFVLLAKLRHTVRLRTRWRAFLDTRRGLSAAAWGARSFTEVYEECKRWLAEQNEGGSFRFLS